MGVRGLWELLSPVGRRVSVEALAGKKLAIDASIWMIQFMKAMRDERGEMVKNGHLLGFFRRICKLLFLRTKPVFVFDGGTPALKRRTVIARRRQRENSQAKIRKTAEKLLLNHLKEMKVKELANNKDSKGKEVIQNEDKKADNAENEAQSSSFNQENIDAMLAASIDREENWGFTRDTETTDSHTFHADNDSDDSEEIILPETQGNIDPAVLASLPPSMQLDLLVQMRERLMADNRQRYQRVKKVPEKFSELQIKSYLKTIAFRREISEVQRSSVGRGMGGLQTSRIASEASREFIFSSSFTGDKQALLSSEAACKDNDNQQVRGASNFSDFLSSCVSDGTPQTATKEDSSAEGSSRCRGGFMDGLETYTDERGNVRLSKVRALGIRMTRDLQRNLDMIKEMEEENGDDESLKKEGISIDILLDEKHASLEDDAEVFAGLVKGGSKEEESEDSADFDWEEGDIDFSGMSRAMDHGSHHLPEGSVNSGVRSVGEMEEEADIKEAVRRSLEENQRRKPLEEDDDCSCGMNQNLGFHDALENEEVFEVEKSNDKETRPSEGLLETRVEDDPDIKEMSMSYPMEWDPLTHERKPGTLSEKKAEAVTYEANQVVSEVNIQINPTPTIDEKSQFSSIGLVGDDLPHGIHDEINTEGMGRFHDDGIATWEVENSVVGDAENSNLLEGVSVVNLEEEIQLLDREIADLGDEQRKLERNAESVSSEMFSECQELLQMFGLPYIIAPMEAEAQCAYLENASLVDAVVTDDADAFLFGARNVHKNIFDDRKYVETYLMKDIEKDIGLTQKKLIDMALLLGSDYTEGVSGIGIVNAIEVLNAFPEKNGLQKFREWIESPDPAILKNVRAEGESISRKSVRKVVGCHNEPKRDSGPAGDHCDEEAHNTKQAFMEQHRNVSKNWHIPSTFPSDVVVDAYLTPQVDKSTEPFSWGKPDIFVLRRMCRECFGWVVQKADELLLPVLKEYEKNETQLRLESFYSFNERFAKIRSKRICRAVKGITGTLPLEMYIHPDHPKKPSTNKRRKLKEKNVSNNILPTSSHSPRRSRRGRKPVDYTSVDREESENDVVEVKECSGEGGDYLVVGGGFCGPDELTPEATGVESNGLDAGLGSFSGIPNLRKKKRG